MSTLSKETIEATIQAPEAAPPAGTQAPPAAGQLHSDAVSLEVPLKVHGSKVTEIVRGITPHTEPFEEQTSSMIVFPHGGVLRMSTPVSSGQMLVLTNLKTRQDAICRVVKVRTYSNSASYVEVEFTHRQPGYWGVYFESDSTEQAQNPAPSAASSEAPAKNPKAAPSSTPAPNFAPPSRTESTFIPIGSQEDVQPAASSTSSAAPKAPRTVAPAVPKKSSEAPLPVSSHAVPPSVSAAEASAKSSSAARSQVEEEDASVAEETPAETRRSAQRNALATGEAFGAGLEAGGESEQASEGSKNWILIAACGALLFLAIGGGIFLFHHKSADDPAAPVQSVAAQPPVTQPVEAPKPPVTVSPAPTRQNSASVRATPVASAKPAREVAAPPAENQPLAQPDEAAAAPPPVAKTTVPSVFGTLNAHPVTTIRTPTVAAPNLDNAVVPPNPGNALLGITSPTIANAPPPPGLNANHPIQVGGRISEPQLVSRGLPQYPAMAKQAHTEGNVVLDIVIEKSGSVKDVKALSGPAVLRQAAVDAVQHWKYQPTLLDGQPVPVEMTVTIRFKL